MKENKNYYQRILALILLPSFLLSSCSSYRPILDPHGRYLQVGEAQAEDDIDECKKEAEDYLDKFKAERAAREAGRKAVVGGVVGAGTGILFGGNLRSTLIGSAIGAGIGAAMGGLSVMGEDNVKPDQMKQRYMGRCLSKRGYSIIGWK
jgi:hypothetical protein